MPRIDVLLLELLIIILTARDAITLAVVVTSAPELKDFSPTRGHSFEWRMEREEAMRNFFLFDFDNQLRLGIFPVDTL